jgi:hypothetical protein
LKNLAGVNDCDIFIERELEEADIEILNVNRKNCEVPYTKEGRLKHYRFKRAWIYWVVEGITSLRIAKIIYEKTKTLSKGFYGDPIRVNGDCGCPKPKQDVYHYHIDTQEGLNEFVRIIKEE